jgi:Vitamin K-dependent gamma-carboxylase
VGKKRKQQRAKAVAAKPVVTTPAPPPVKQPVFWFGFEVSWGKLAVARVVIFTLLALDAVLQVSHAPRYRAGDFNVGQLPFMEAITPGRVLYGVAQLALAYVFVLVAFGVLTRVLVPLAAVTYAWLYFSSQLDGYQHHYLVVMMLAIASFVPWQRPAGAVPSRKVQTWAVRLLLVQLAVMYLWAAISKMDPAWIDGTTLSLQMTGKIGTVIAKTIGFRVASVLVVATELTLAATVWSRATWKIAAPLGLAFHLGIVFTGLEIGLFAFLMLGIYALVLSDEFWARVVLAFEGLARVLARQSWPGFAACLALGVVIALLVRTEDARVVGICACLVPIVAALVAKKPLLAIGVAHVLALGLWLFVDRVTSATEDYYKYWGGSQRRIGSPEQAEYAYRRLTEVAPDKELGHFHLGKLLTQRGAIAADPRVRAVTIDEGLAELHEAQRLEPAVARSFVEEARVLVKQGKLPEAIEKAKQATFADPSHAQARALLDSLTGTAKPTPEVVDDSE